MVPWIFTSGAEAFASLGTAKSTGTTGFALAGKINRVGLIEIPMGITIREVVDDIGGGIPDDKEFKAVQIGGPSGGCIPAHLAHIPVDFEALTSVGAIMGSGGFVVLDEDDCMVDIARYFLEFTQDQSCGRCTFCRTGTKRMLEILERLCAGEGKKGDIEKLEHLADLVKKGSLCGLGQTAPNPVITTIKYFRDEYEAHLEKRCPAGKCRDLISLHITEDCIGCTLCAQHCPTYAITPKPYEQHEIDMEKCVRCFTCVRTCPVDAIQVKSP
jgi:NADH:ubiquinone oxidoreductase subunit F (NADH-binding)